MRTGALGEPCPAVHSLSRQSAEGAGLVSHSTTQKSWPRIGVGDLLTIERQEARFIRLQRNLGLAAKLHMMELQGQRTQTVMVTPTYAPGVQWEASHIATLVDHIRKWLRRKTGEKLRYVWVAETQDGSRREDGFSRDMLHYHCVLFVRKGLRIPMADAQGWWPHGMTNTKACTSPVGYVMSYAKKFASKTGIPKGARIYGVGGLDREARSIRRWVNWPPFVRARAAITDNYARQPGGGWTNLDTGEWWPSEYGLAGLGKGKSFVVRLHDHGRPIADLSGPFSWLPQA